jgi:hypothetical protein
MFPPATATPIHSLKTPALLAALLLRHHQGLFSRCAKTSRESILSLASSMRMPAWLA